MVIHGQKDALIPASHGGKLFDLLSTQKMMISPTGMGHNESLFTDASWFAQPMHQFFALPDFTFQDVQIPNWARSRNLLLSQQACRALTVWDEASDSWSRSDSASSATSTA